MTEYRTYHNNSWNGFISSELNDIDVEYDANVQSYTYEHVIENLPDNMSVEDEQVLEDNSILLTIAVG